jgi:iron complex outermembrane receptor protein
VQDAYNVTNLRLGWRNDRFGATIWSKNLFDERYKAYSLDLGALGATTYYAPPRTIGVTLEAFF